MSAILIEYTEDQFEEELNSIYGTVSICGSDYEQGTIYRELDAVAFRCDMLDSGGDQWECSECGEVYEGEEEAEECCRKGSDYSCLTCKSEHDNQDDANECCRQMQLDKLKESK